MEIMVPDWLITCHVTLITSSDWLFICFRYNLCEFENVVTAVRNGNIKLLNETIEEHAAFFIRAGIYLILEKLKVITRNRPSQEILFPDWLITIHVT